MPHARVVDDGEELLVRHVHFLLRQLRAVPRCPVQRIFVELVPQVHPGDCSPSRSVVSKMVILAIFSLLSDIGRFRASTTCVSQKKNRAPPLERARSFRFGRLFSRFPKLAAGPP